MNIKIYKNYDTLNILKSPNNIYNESDELAKAFALTLKIPQESFILDKTLGSDFGNKIRQLKQENLKSNLISLLKEIALSFQLINIENVEYIINQERSSLILSITIKISNNIYLISLEVLI